MKAIIKNYRRGIGTNHNNQLVASVESVTTKAGAQKLVGKKAVWKTRSGKTMAGTVSAVHGDRGAIRLRFATPLPPEALGTTLEIK